MIVDVFTGGWGYLSSVDEIDVDNYGETGAGKGHGRSFYAALDIKVAERYARLAAFKYGRGFVSHFRLDTNSITQVGELKAQSVPIGKFDVLQFWETDNSPMGYSLRIDNVNCLMDSDKAPREIYVD